VPEFVDETGVIGFAPVIERLEFGLKGGFEWKDFAKAVIVVWRTQWPGLRCLDCATFPVDVRTTEI